MGAVGTAKAWVEFAERKKIADFGKIKTVEDAQLAAENDYKQTINQIPEFDADAFLSGAMEMEEAFLPEQIREAVREYKEGNKEKLFEIIKKNVLTATKKEIDIKLSFYCGDACGRENDFSDTDLKFALNLNIPVFTPEYIFLNNNEYFPRISIVS